MAEPVALALTLPGAGWRARALDGKGRPTEDVRMVGDVLVFGAEYATLWYLIER